MTVAFEDNRIGLGRQREHEPSRSPGIVLELVRSKLAKTSRTNQRWIAHLDASLQGTGSNGTNELFGAADSKSSRPPGLQVQHQSCG